MAGTNFPLDPRPQGGLEGLAAVVTIMSWVQSQPPIDVPVAALVLMLMLVASGTRA